MSPYDPNARRRERYATDPVYREKRKAAVRAGQARANARRRERYANDPEYRERIKAKVREAQEKANARRRARYASDAEYRKRCRAAAKARLPRKAELDRARYASDPEYREQRKAAARSQGHRRHLPTLVMRQAFVCARCGSAFDEDRPATVDHIIPRARWPKGEPGMDDLTNLQALCGPCNSSKCDRIEDPNAAAGLLPLILTEDR